MREITAAPGCEQLVLVDGGEQDQRITARTLEEADAFGAIERRLEMIDAARPLQSGVAEQRRIGNAAADVFLVARVARDDQAVAVCQRHRAVAADLELFVEMREISRADGREHHATEAAIQLV